MARALPAPSFPPPPPLTISSPPLPCVLPQVYLLLSCCPCEGRISGIVDVPNAVATLAVPLAIFDQVTGSSMRPLTCSTGAAGRGGAGFNQVAVGGGMRALTCSVGAPVSLSDTTRRALCV